MVTEHVSVCCHRCGYFGMGDSVPHAMQLLKAHETVCPNPKPSFVQPTLRSASEHREGWRRFVKMLNGNHV